MAIWSTDVLLVGQYNLVREEKERSQQCDWECLGLQHAKGESQYVED